MPFATFEITFPIIGCAIVALGVLVAVFNRRVCQIQRVINEAGLWWVRVSISPTPEGARLGGIILASFGAVWLGLVAVIEILVLTSH